MPEQAALSGLSLDLPGFGASPAPEVPWGSRDYARAIAPILEEIGRPVVVVGHSHGGRVAVALAEERPDLVAGLGLIGAPVLRRPSTAKPALRYRVLRALNRAHLISDQRFEATRRRSGSADYQAAEGVMRDTLVRVINESFDDELARLEVPVALVWGELDEDVPIDVARRAETIIGSAHPARPEVVLRTVEGVGHLTVTAAPSAVRSELDRMLAEVIA